ncbi:MAG: hypothetical protein V8T31_02535 [Lachnospiraceae bacterium]
MLTSPGDAAPTSGCAKGVFYSYSNDARGDDFTNTAYLQGRLSSLEYMKFDGYLALDELDLDWNGTEKMLAMRVKTAGCR